MSLNAQRSYLKSITSNLEVLRQASGMLQPLLRPRLPDGADKRPQWCESQFVTGDWTVQRFPVSGSHPSVTGTPLNSQAIVFYSQSLCLSHHRTLSFCVCVVPMPVSINLH